MKQRKCPIANMVCPKNSDPDRGPWCPAWVRYTEKHVESGKERIGESCIYQYIPYAMQSVIAASTSPAASIESMRNEVASGLGKVARSFQKMPEMTAQRLQALEHDQDE